MSAILTAFVILCKNALVTKKSLTSTHIVQEFFIKAAHKISAHSVPKTQISNA